MEWINCSERLPEDEEKVIGSDGKHVDVYRFQKEYTTKDKKRNGVFREMNEDWEIDISIKYWMPLPLPPKEEEPYFERDYP